MNDADVLAVHLVPRARHDLVELFGGETGDDVDKFGRCDWRAGPSGLPILGAVSAGSPARSSRATTSATTAACCSSRSTHDMPPASCCTCTT